MNDFKHNFLGQILRYNISVAIPGSSLVSYTAEVGDPEVSNYVEFFIPRIIPKSQTPTTIVVEAVPVGDAEMPLNNSISQSSFALLL